jgi:hypothetical protein
MKVPHHTVADGVPGEDLVTCNMQERIGILVEIK